MSFLGNIVWLVLGGLLTFVLYLFHGLLFCITIVGIPFGLKHFELAKSSLFPFGMSNRGK